MTYCSLTSGPIFEKTQTPLKLHVLHVIVSKREFQKSH